MSELELNALVRRCADMRDRLIAEVVWQLASHIDRGCDLVLRSGMGREWIALGPNGPDIFEIRTRMEGNEILFEAIPIFDVEQWQ